MHTGESILIVEDEASLLAYLVLAFRRAGYEVVGESNFQDGRRSLRARPFTALLADVRLGEYNGVHLALLARELYPGIKVVVFSGFDDPVLREEAERAGARFALKPIEVPALLAMLTSPNG